MFFRPLAGSDSTTNVGDGSRMAMRLPFNRTVRVAPPLTSGEINPEQR
jgi:hypothetical protein